MRLVIVSGTSGAGKTIALQVLEDMGFYCIDNLPIALLPSFVIQLTAASGRGYGDAAVGIDARNLVGDFAEFGAILDHIKAQGLVCELIFLDADTTSLLKRFSETRRRHPLTKKGTSLREAIEAERKVLKPITERADWHVDTTRTTIHQLRDLIRTRMAAVSESGLALMFLSFGFKYGLPSDADTLFDVRCLPNPHWDPAMRTKTGRDPEVIEFLCAQPAVEKMCQDIGNFVAQWLPLYEQENRSYMTVAIGCTGGQHRSVYIVEQLASRFAPTRSNVVVRHRELP